MILDVLGSFLFFRVFRDVCMFFSQLFSSVLWPDGDGHDVCGARSRVVSLIKSQKFGVSDFGVLGDV